MSLPGKRQGKKDGVTERLHLFSIQGKPEGLRSTVFLKALDVFFL
jgi:hypothetical protein